MEIQHDSESAPAYSSTATQSTLTIISEQLFKLQEQLLQLRLDMAGETKSASGTPVTPTDSERLSIMNKNDKAKPTLTPGALGIEMFESPCLIQTRSRIDKIRDELRENNSCEESSISNDILLAWCRSRIKTDYNLGLCNQLEQLMKDETYEIRHLHRLRVEHQRQLIMSQDQGRESAIPGIDRLEKAISQLAASIATERSHTTIETKHVSLQSQPSSTVSEADKRTKSMSSSFPVQPQQVMEQEVTSLSLMRIQAKLEVVGNLMCNISRIGQLPRPDELPAEAKADPDIMAIWPVPNWPVISSFNSFRNGLNDLIKELRVKEEEERKYLHGVRK